MMMRSRLTALGCALLGLLVVRGAVAGESVAAPGTAQVLQLPGRSLAAVRSGAAVTAQHALRVTVTVTNTGRRPFAVLRTDFSLSSQADLFAARGWDRRGDHVTIAPHRSSVLRLTFDVPPAAATGATVLYRPADRTRIGVIRLGGPAAAHRPVTHARAATSTINTFWATQGVGDPWGTAVDASGNVWFAEPGCDFTPTCPAGAGPGQIGEIKASNHAVVFTTLPNIPGNHPIFLTFDSSGNLWFTTPDNSRIGEFSPSSGTFVGQWPVTAGSGPWDLAFSGSTLWYTEHLGSAIGSFDPSSHAHQDHQTPSAGSQPYGIAVAGGSIWFTENNSSVDRVGVLNTKNNAISEYPIVQPTSGTPHLMTVDASGHPWWTEGWSNTIATLDQAAATPGQCGTTSGTCAGIRRYRLPAPATCASSGTHASGIAYGGSPTRVWLDNSLTAQVGSFDPSSAAFSLTTLGNCSAHPHDGLTLDQPGHVWFDEEFANAIGELIP
jgi:streptogramin lyase